MTGAESLGKAVLQVVSLLERILDLRFFMRVSTAVLYLAFIFWSELQKPVWAITSDEINSIFAGKWILIASGYVALVAYGCRFLSGVLIRALRMFDAYCLPLRKTWSSGYGMVPSRYIHEEAHRTKDYEIVRQLEKHQEKCREVRSEKADLAYLSFTVLLLFLMNKLFASNDLVQEGIRYLAPNLAEDGLLLIEVLIALPLIMFILEAVGDDYSQDYYLHHEVLYKQMIQNRPRPWDR